MAAIGRPPVLLADEPTAELDHEAGRRLLDSVDRLAARGTCVVFATHDPAAEERADHVISLDHGRSRPQAGERPPVTAVELDCGVEALPPRLGEAVHVPEDASVMVGAGELVGLVGPSGSGKTTLLNLVCGWETPDAGEYSGGRPAPTTGPSWPSCRRRSGSSRS